MMYKIISSIKLTGIIGMFLWISFFAPLIGDKYQVIFLIVIAILLLASLIFDRNVYKLIFDKKDAPFWIFLLLIMGGLINIKDSSVAYRHFWAFIFPIPFLYFYAKSVFQERHRILILRCICIMAASVAIYGFMELIFGKNLVYVNYINNSLYNMYVGSRMMSVHSHPAPLGTYLAAIFPLSLALYMMEKNRLLKLISIICAVIIFTGALFTFSRGVLLALLIEMLIIAFFSIKEKRIYYFYIILLPVLVILISSILNHYYGGLKVNFGRYSFRILTLVFEYSRKFMLFLGAEKMILDQPFFGVGFGHFRVLFDHYFPSIASITEYDKKIADCMYLTILAETGIIGFGGFMFFLYSIFKNIYRVLKVNLDNQNRFLLVGFFSGFIGIMCTFLTYDTLYWTAPSYIFWSYAGILSYLSAKKCH